jgi:hypothetical protein
MRVFAFSIYISAETFSEMQIIYVLNLYLDYANWYTVQVSRMLGKYLK